MELGDPADGSLARLASAYGSAWGVADDRTSQASIILLDYSWYAFAPLVAAYLVEGVVPSLDDARVGLDPATRTGTLHLRDAQPRPATSVRVLREAIEEHVAPLVDELVRRRWIGRRGAWLAVGDRVVGAFEHLGELARQVERARAEAEALVHEPGTALDSPRHRFVTYPAGEGERTIGVRASCCRFYRTTAREKCITCPLVTERERAERIVEWAAGA